MLRCAQLAVLDHFHKVRREVANETEAWQAKLAAERDGSGESAEKRGTVARDHTAKETLAALREFENELNEKISQFEDEVTSNRVQVLQWATPCRE